MNVCLGQHSARGRLLVRVIERGDLMGTKNSARTLTERLRGPAARFTAVGAIAVSTLVVAAAPPAAAAVPQFPDNIVVFPDRDFLAIEGFSLLAGQTALIEVVRGGQVVGSTTGQMTAGDPALEVNHPGGVCWGNGTGLNVTPDIVPGDVVRLSVAGEALGDTTVADTYVDTDTSLTGTTLTVTGFIAPGVDRNRLEQRIVNPDLTDTDVNRRDIRAVPGPMTPAPKGGYSSQLVIAGNRFTATYQFLLPTTAAIAAGGGGERMMSWQVEDAQANRQGLTIAEYGEAGGPGMGGCPAGPSGQGAPQPGFSSAVRNAAGTSATVSWEGATAVPGGPAVTGYSVALVDQAGNMLGKRTDAVARRAVINGLDPAATYNVEVRSLADTMMSLPSQPPLGGPAGTDITPPPATTASPASGAATSVTLTNADPDAEIYYTTNGTAPITASDVSTAATHYTAPIAITSPVTLTWAAIDPSSNVGPQGSGSFSPQVVNAPAPPTSVNASALSATSARATWPAVTGATSYVVQAYTAANATVGAAITTTALAQNVTGLLSNTAYSIGVKAVNGGGTSAETRSTAFTTPATTDTVTILFARFRPGDFRVRGASTANSGTVSVYAANPAIADTTPIAGLANLPLIAAVAPETGSVFDGRVRATPAVGPQLIWVKSSNGGVAGPFTVTN
jgi:hypothetical protein